MSACADLCLDWGHHDHRDAMFDHYRGFALSLYFQIHLSDLATDQFKLILESDNSCAPVGVCRLNNLTCNPFLIRLSLYAGVVRSRWVSWSSKPVVGRVASRGGFDSHPLSPILSKQVTVTFAKRVTVTSDKGIVCLLLKLKFLTAMYPSSSTLKMSHWVTRRNGSRAIVELF